MALTKTQTAVICAVLAAAPLLYQHNATAHLKDQQAAITSQLQTDQKTLSDLEAAARRDQNALTQAQSEEQNAQLRLARLNSQAKGTASTAAYQWDDNSPLARIPKAYLEPLSKAMTAAANQRGLLNNDFKEIIQMTDSEAQAVQESIERFIADYEAEQAAKIKKVEPTANDHLLGDSTNGVRIFEVPGIGKKYQELQTRFTGELAAILGTERKQLFYNALDGWMQTSEYGTSSSMSLFTIDRRVQFYKPRPGASFIEQGMSYTNGYMRFSIGLDDIPQHLRPYLQDWIDLAKQNPDLHQ